MTALDLALWLAATPALSIFAVFINELLFGIVPLGRRQIECARSTRIAILVPAHNEAQGIGQTLARLRDAVPAQTQILVVADNCTDNTADIARASGVSVVSRDDAERRGKGYALDFGRSHLATNPPECVIILDADCLPEPGAIAHLAAAAVSLQSPAQSINLIRAAPGAGPMVEISNYAFMIKNLIRQRGLVRCGGPALLTGTGMAFPWALFARLPLASANIVEDLALTVTLARDGVRPILVEQANVWSDAAAAGDTLTQRTRWEHGFLATARKLALPTLATGLLRGQLASIRLGLHLLVPPLALLFALGLGLAAILAGFAAFGATPLPAIFMLGLMATSIILLGLAWWREGRSLLSAAAIARIPLYVVWKIPVYLKLLKGSQSEWIRTRRPD